MPRGEREKRILEQIQQRRVSGGVCIHALSRRNKSDGVKNNENQIYGSRNKGEKDAPLPAQNLTKDKATEIPDQKLWKRQNEVESISGISIDET